jgi:peptidoglycan/xylan/chitin deacetylase (PgdA/CDA1 family)
MAVKMPDGKRFAICFSFDVDITSLWLGCFKFHTMNPLSRGEFGVEGLRRILDLLDKYEIKGTFYVPGHTALHHPSETKEIVTRGHDIGSHGMYHQPKEVGLLGTNTSVEEMRGYLRQQLDAIEKVTGTRPTGFRSPIVDYTADMPQLLLEEGYLYDSSMQGSDFVPYRLRIGDKYQFEEPYDIKYGSASKIVEIPFMWDLDDFPHYEFMSYYLDPNNGWYGSAPLSSPEKVKEVWLGHFDYMYESIPGGVYTTCQHPQCTGRGMRLKCFEDIIQYMRSKPDVWFATHREIAENYVDE